MGIKVCRFTDPSLINIEHNEVDVESPLWKTINENQNVYFKKTNTYMLVYSNCIVLIIKFIITMNIIL